MLGQQTHCIVPWAFQIHWHYVLRGGVSEKCCNLQNPLITSCQLGQVEICSTLRDLICHILWPFYCHFMAFFDQKWPYLAIGSPSNPKWVEHWLNKVEHCTSHLGGWVWTPMAPKKGHLGAPEPPKNYLFWPMGSKKKNITRTSKMTMLMTRTFREHPQ